MAELLGFEQKGSKGSHQTYVRAQEAMLLNFQNRKGLIKSYQAEQLIAMIEKYGNQQDDESS